MKEMKEMKENKINIGDKFEYKSINGFTFTVFGKSDSDNKLNIIIEQNDEPYLYKIKEKEVTKGLVDGSVIEIKNGETNGGTNG